MAKEQNLSLNPSKISGVCGRLMCCLTYEYKTYLEQKKGLPKMGKKVMTEKGEGKVIRQNIMDRITVVMLPDGEEVEIEHGLPPTAVKRQPDNFEEQDEEFEDENAEPEEY